MSLTLVKRQKSTRVKGSPKVFEGLDLPCDSSHEHLGWQPYLVDGSWVYPTKDEAAYPPGLCNFLCKAATSATLQHPRFQVTAVKASMNMRSQVRASASVKTKHAAPLIPEFRACVFLSQVPEGHAYKLLSQPPASRSGEGAEAGLGRLQKKRKGVAGPPSAKPSPGHDPRVGVYRSMEEHVAIAETLWSPFDDFSGVPDQVRSNLFRMLNLEAEVASLARRECPL